MLCNFIYIRIFAFLFFPFHISAIMISDENKISPEGISAARKANHIKVPKIYWGLTRKAVLTMEWIDGIKLTNEDRIEKAHLNRKELVDQVIVALQASDNYASQLFFFFFCLLNMEYLCFKLNVHLLLN